jgi:hypothetical protein
MWAPLVMSSAITILVSLFSLLTFLIPELPCEIRGHGVLVQSVHRATRQPTARSTTKKRKL